MKVLLISPPINILHSSSKSYCDNFPIGLMYLQAFLKQNGYIQTEIRTYWNIDKNVIRADIESFEPDVIGITCLSINHWYALSIARSIKKIVPSMPIVIGGIHASYVGKRLLSPGSPYDYVIYFEGEYSFRDLLDSFSGKRNIDSVSGVSYKRNGEIYTTQYGKRIENLDMLPFPCYESLNKKMLSRTRIFNIVASRGCLFKCSYCNASAFYQHQWIHRSPENIVDELKYLRQKYNAKRIAFNDDFVTADKKYAKKLFSLIAENNRTMTFILQTRPDFIDEELLVLMKRQELHH